MGKKINRSGIWVNQDIKPRKYIVVSRKFDGVYAAACPCVGQVATNSKLFAYLLYYSWQRFAEKNINNGYTIAVMLMKRTRGYPYSEIQYEAIKR